MYSVLIILSVIISIVLTVIVLLQSSKGGGLAGTFGGANMGSMFGTRRTADFLSKTTWWLAGSLLILAIVVNLFFLPGVSSGDGQESIIQKSGRQNIPTTPSLPQSIPNQ